MNININDGIAFVAIAFGIIFIFIIQQRARNSGKKEEYECTAGKILRRGDPVPKWILNELWEFIGILPLATRRGHHKGSIVICRSVLMAGEPAIISIEILNDGRKPQSGETFDISKTGELEFNRQPNL